jgi:predicted enzyme related to lactoylglutathione lyase
MTGKVVHFEVPASKPKRAQSFYRDVFGWGMEEMPEMDYTMVTTAPVDKEGRLTEPGAINGGMMKKTKRFSAPIITIQVDDIDSALDAVAKHGGKAVVKKTPIGPYGFSAYFKDTEGNLMGLFQLPSK